MASAAVVLAAGIGMTGAAASPRADVGSLTETLDRFLDSRQASSCEATQGRLEDDACPRCKKVWDLTSKRSCEELFSGRAPAWAAPSNAASFLPGAPQAEEWLPFCSVYQVDSQLAKLPFPTRDRMQTALQRTQEYQRNRDLCDPKGKYFAEMNRYDEKYEPPTQEERAMRPMTVDERKEMMATARRWIDRVAGECCGSDAECAKYFKRLRLPECKPATDPKVSDPCLDHAAFWEKKEKGYGPDAGEPDWRPSADEPFYPGRMLLAPYVPTDNRVTMTTEGLLAHELAHQCSNIHIQLAKYHRQPDAIHVPSTSKDPGCVITEPVKKFYRKLLARIDVTAETAECLFERTGRAPQLRFRPSEPCKDGCAVIQLDEAYSMLHGLAHTEAVADAVPLYLPGQLCGMRDAEHPMGADVLACALRSPKLRAKMEAFVKCRSLNSNR